MTKKKTDIFPPDQPSLIGPGKTHPNCVECGAWKLAKTPFMAPTIPAKRPVLYLLGERPGHTEDRIGVQFKGPSGTLLRAWMEEAGIDPNACSWDNVLKCGGTGDKPTMKEMRLCRPFTLRNLLDIKPPKVVGLGQYAAIQLQDDGRATVKRDRNRDLTIPGLPGQKATVTFHPGAYIHGNHQVRQHIPEDLGRALIGRKVVRAVREITSGHELGDVCGRLADSDAFSFDLEWSTETGKLLLASVCDGTESYWWGLGHRESKLSWEDTREPMSVLFGGEATKIGYNMAGDMIRLAEQGINVAGPILDVFVMVKLIDENYPDKSLEHIAARVLDYPDYAQDMRPFKQGIRVPTGEVAKNGKPKTRLSKDYGNAPMAVLGPYCAWDSWGPYDLADKWIDDCRGQPWWKLFLVYMRAEKALTRSSFEGFRVDPDNLGEQEKVLRRDAKKTKAALLRAIKPHWYAKREFQFKQSGIGPHDQAVRDLLFRRLKLKSTEQTKAGKPSVDRKTLQTLQIQYPDHEKLIRLLIELRGADKLIGTYMVKLREKMIWREKWSYWDEDLRRTIVMPAGWYFQPGYNIAGARTGRLSSRPNIQNIPKKTVRRAFRSRWG